MRQYLRCKAHHNMRQAGFAHVDRKLRRYAMRSFFAAHWRDFI